MVNEDFADLTITEKDILEVIGEEVEEDVITRDEQNERKVSIPSSNIVAKANMAQVMLTFLYLMWICLGQIGLRSRRKSNIYLLI